MVLFFGSLLWVSAGAVVFPLPPSATWPDTKGGYRDVLWPQAHASLRRCSLIVFTDGVVSPLALYQLWTGGQERGGGAVFEVVASHEIGTNHTQSLLQWVSLARRLRVSAWCVTVVVMSDDPVFLAAFGEVSDKARLMVWETRLLVITRVAMPRLRSLIEDYWNLSMMNTVILKLHNTLHGHGWKAFVYFPYTPTGPQVVHVASWRPNYGWGCVNGHTLFPEKYKNFYGMVVNMTVFPMPPYWMDDNSWEGNGNDSKKLKITGRDYIILETIAQGLNFSINVLPYGEWDEVMMRLEARTAFISPIKLAILPNLMKKYDYSSFIERATLGFSMAKPTLKPSWQSLYYPMKVEVWVSVLATILLVFNALLVMTKQSGESETWRVWLVVEQVVGILLDENISGKLPRRNPTRMVLLAWLIFAFIVGTLYRSNLTASLTVPKYLPRAETLAELVDRGVIITTASDAIDFINNFKQSDSKLYQTVAERTQIVPSYEVGMQESLKNNKAYLYERLNMMLLIAEHFTGKGGSTPLYVARQNIMPGYCGWPLAPNTPFKTNLDHYILAFHGAGLIVKWTTEVLERAQFNSQRCRMRVLEDRSAPVKEEESVEDHKVTMALTVVHMQGPLFLYLAGAFLSFATFLIETTITLTLSSRSLDKWVSETHGPHLNLPIKF